MPKSYAPEVIADSSGQFYRNALRFATAQEAEESAYALFCRWTLCREYRASATEEPVNYKRVDGRDVPIGG